MSLSQTPPGWLASGGLNFYSIPLLVKVACFWWIEFLFNSSLSQGGLDPLLILHFQSLNNVQLGSSEISTVITVNNYWGISSANKAQNCVDKAICRQVFGHSNVNCLEPQATCIRNACFKSCESTCNHWLVDVYIGNNFLCKNFTILVSAWVTSDTDKGVGLSFNSIFELLLCSARNFGCEVCGKHEWDTRLIFTVDPI